MHKEDKERVVAELADKLRGSDTLIVADYRGLSMTQIDALRGRLLEHGAKFTVVKNTLTRRAAEAAGAHALLALLFDVLRGQVLGAVIAPLTSLLALVNAPLQDLFGLIDARANQLGNQPVADSPGETTQTTSHSGEDGMAEEATTDGGS